MLNPPDDSGHELQIVAGYVQDIIKQLRQHPELGKWCSKIYYDDGGIEGHKCTVGPDDEILKEYSSAITSITILSAWLHNGWVIYISATRDRRWSQNTSITIRIQEPDILERAIHFIKSELAGNVRRE